MAVCGRPAADKGVKIFAWHLKTPAGKKQGNNDYAEIQYRVLTGHSDPTGGDLYVPIAEDRAAAGMRGFGGVVEGVGAQMVELVRATGTAE